MKVYTYSEARQRLASLLDQARREGQVRIRRRDGQTFVLRPVTTPRSPLDVPGVPARLSPGELEAILEESRRSADPIWRRRLPKARLQPTKARRSKNRRPNER
jgi:antitoxin Phd